MGTETTKMLLSANEVAELAGISTTSAYRLIRQFNAELKAAGKYTITGKVSRAYFFKKFDVSEL